MPVQGKSKPVLFDLAGRPLHVGSVLGSGAEGAVYEIRDRSDAVVKLYHKALDPEKSAKIAAMAKIGNERLLKLTAWPTEPILAGSATGRVSGFIMPKIAGHRQAFNLYSPKLRLQEFPTAGWQFLIRSAANAARAFNVVHENGHVIGDVKDQNLLVGGNATVQLVDCDSFQITINGSSWLCEVGTAPYQPPEFQNVRSYKTILRTPNHDNFGLAVIIFQMLFMARHPFSGRFLGSGEMPMETAISEYRFAYGTNAAAMQMLPPPASLGLNGVTRDVALLFERAFSKQGSEPNGRPRADEWVTALQDLEKHLKKCAVNPAHQFVHTLSNCPWCEIENTTGVPLFPVSLVGSAQTSFTIAAFWAKVNSVPNPGPPPALPRVGGVAVTVSRAVAELQEAVSNAKRAAEVAAAMQVTSRLQSLKNENETRAADARGRWQNLQNKWGRYTNDKDFRDLLSRLQHLRAQYDALPQKRSEELQKLEANRYQVQLQAHLDRCRISHARIDGVHSLRKATLQSFGIETAADILDHRVLAVPGFGPVLLNSLKRWRDQQQRRFIFDPNKGVDQAAKNAVERLILTEKIGLERKLNEGLSRFTVSSHHIMTLRRSLIVQAERTAHDLAQAEADLRALEQAARELAQAEGDLRRAEQDARDKARAKIIARAESAATFAIGVLLAGGLIVATYMGMGQSPVTPPPVPQQSQPQVIQPTAVSPISPVQLALPPHVEKDAHGQLRPEDGYEWSNDNHMSVRWTPGKASLEYPHIFTSSTEGGWQPEDGYGWAEPMNIKNKSVRWVPGTASNRYPNVVAAAVEGQWQPADGYVWVLNPPRLEDMRVKPVPRAENQTSTPLSENPFQQGLNDRTAFEQWVADLSGDFRQGVEWWAGRRSLSKPGFCNGAAATSLDFVSGCEAAKARLTPLDVQRTSNPEYRRGWNTYVGAITPLSAPTLHESGITERVIDAPPDSDAGAADRLNARQLQLLRGQ